MPPASYYKKRIYNKIREDMEHKPMVMVERAGWSTAPYYVLLVILTGNWAELFTMDPQYAQSPDRVYMDTRTHRDVHMDVDDILYYPAEGSSGVTMFTRSFQNEQMGLNEEKIVENISAVGWNLVEYLLDHIKKFNSMGAYKVDYFSLHSSEWIDLADVPTLADARTYASDSECCDITLPYRILGPTGRVMEYWYNGKWAARYAWARVMWQCYYDNHVSPPIDSSDPVGVDNYYEILEGIEMLENQLKELYPNEWEKSK